MPGPFRFFIVFIYLFICCAERKEGKKFKLKQEKEIKPEKEGGEKNKKVEYK